MAKDASNAGARTPVAFLGLGQMGSPMARRLLAAGFPVRGADVSRAARQRFAEAGGEAFASAGEAAQGCSTIVTMLPDGGVVRSVVLAPDGPAATLAPGALVLEMSSSAPQGTVGLAAELAGRGIRLIDAPVSGGVVRAVDGTLSTMVGGDEQDVAEARPLLEAMARTVIATGPVGSGHAMKALNNYVSAAGLLAACEAVRIGERFGIDPETVVDVLNASTGRNNSTEVKLKQFVLSGTFGSGFSLSLMAKDLGTAAGLARGTGADVSLLDAVSDLWSQADRQLGAGADHTEIARFRGQTGEPARTDT